MFHTIIIAGNVGRDPEMRYTPSGAAVTSFSVATSRSYRSRDGQPIKETVWFRITCWNKLAEFANNYVRKGHKVLIEGRLVADNATGGPRTFTRADGTSGASFEVNAASLQLLDRMNNGEGAAPAAAPQAGSASYTTDFADITDVDENDIPF